MTWQYFTAMFLGAFAGNILAQVLREVWVRLRKRLSERNTPHELPPIQVGDRVAWHHTNTAQGVVMGTVTEAHPEWHGCQYTVAWDGNPSWPSATMAEGELITPVESDGPRRNVPKPKRKL